jgi:hypothetical protein
LLWANVMVTASSGVIFPVGAPLLEPLRLLHEKFLGENPVHLWTSVGGVLGVASSLEVSSLELGLWCRCVAIGGTTLGGGG